MLRQLRLSLTPLSLLMIFSSSLFAQPWSEKLGFPKGAKVVILDAKEVGICWEANESAKELLSIGRISSASLVATGPRFNDFAEWARDKKVDVGLSVTLINPHPSLSWRLLTSEQGPTSLVDADGYPWKSVVQLVANAETNDVQRELDAQLSRLRQAGVRPSHICGYRGTLVSRVDLMAVLLGASRKYWIPTPVVELTPELIERFRSEGFPIGDDLVELVSTYPLPKLDDIRWIPPADTYEAKQAGFRELLKTLQPGLTMVTLQAAVETPGMKSLTEDWQQRSWTSKLLADDQLLATFKEEGVIVTSWTEVMKRFEMGRSAPGANENSAEVTAQP